MNIFDAIWVIFSGFFNILDFLGNWFFFLSYANGAFLRLMGWLEMLLWFFGPFLM